MLLPFKVLLGLCLLAIFSVSTPAMELAEFLQTAWGTDQTARNFADQNFPLLQQHSDAATADYAYAIVLTKQRRYAEARTACDSLLRSDRPDWRVLQLATFLDLMLRDREWTQAELQQLLEQVPQLQDGQPDQALELAHWIGMAMGTLVGPLSERARPLPPDPGIDRLVAGLKPDAKAEYLDGQTVVLREFQRRLQEIARLDHQQNAEQSRQRAELQNRLTQQLEVITSQLGQVQNDIRQARDAHVEQRRPLEAHVPRAISQATYLDSRESAINWRLWTLDAELIRLDRLIAQEKDPVRRRQLECQRDALAAQLFWDSYSLDSTRAARFSAEFELRQLQHQLARVDRSAAQERLDLERRRAELVKARTKAERQQQRLAEPSRRRTGGLRALQNQATSVSTYLQFPLEQERQRLIAIRPGG